jgi:spermidine/putrescine transport system permease protein
MSLARLDKSLAKRRIASKRSVSLRRFPGVRTAALLFFLYLYLPITILVVLSFNANRTVTIWEGFSLDWYRVALENPNILDSARNSLVLALSAMALSTVAATMAALAMARAKFKGQGAVAAMMGLPLIVPEIVTAVATLLLFSAIGLGLGMTSLIIAHTVFCIPFAYLPIRARLEGMDPFLREAAADLYANDWRAFVHVTLPLLWPGIFSGAALAFIISLDDFVISFFLAGAGSTTLPVYIFGMVRMGVTPEVNAISVMMLVVSVAFVSLSFLVQKRH